MLLPAAVLLPIEAAETALLSLAAKAGTPEEENWDDEQAP
jgi:hypothetical protein